MSLDNFQLPSGLLPELYKNSLVVLESRQIKTDSFKAENLSFLGGFSKRILLLVHEPLNKNSSPEVFTFLLSVLQACKLSMDDVALLDISANEGNNLNKLLKELNYKTLISFGITSSILESGMNEKPYQITNIENRNYLFVDTLIEISQNNVLKKSLWTSLKSIFSIS